MNLFLPVLAAVVTNFSGIVTFERGDLSFFFMRSDDGVNWRHWITLEDSPILQYSYPSIIQGRDGHIHVVYTWRRQRVKHVELVP